MRPIISIYSTGHTYDRDKLQVCKEQMMKVVLGTQMTIQDTDDIVYHNGVRVGFALLLTVHMEDTTFLLLRMLPSHPTSESYSPK